MAKKETWKSFSLPSSLRSVLISRGLARLLSITIAHLFSFVSPPVSPFNPFSFPPPFPLQLLSFQPDLSIFGNSYFFHNPSQSFHELSDKFFFTSSTCLSSFSSFFQPHIPYFSFDCFPPRFSSLPFSARTHFHSVKCTISPSSLSKALRGPIKFSGLMSLSNPTHLELTGL